MKKRLFLSLAMMVMMAVNAMAQKIGDKFLYNGIQYEFYRTEVVKPLTFLYVKVIPLESGAKYKGKIEMPMYFNYNDNVFFVDSIAEECFMDCTQLTSVSMSDLIRTIPTHAFSGCTATNEITLSEATETIDVEAFANCRIQYIKIPKSVKTIEDAAFINCTVLREVEFEESASLKKLGNAAFYNCSYITSIKLPKTTEFLGANAFGYCVRLKTINIPANANYLGNDLMYDCDNVELITCESTEPQILQSNNTIPNNAVIQVPKGYKAQYTSNRYWEQYAPNIVDNYVDPDLPTCEKPVVIFENGILTMSCPTKGAKLLYNITSMPTTFVKPSTPTSISDLKNATLTCYAIADGYNTSPTVTKYITINGNDKFDVNGDGSVNISDVTSLVNKILNK